MFTLQHSWNYQLWAMFFHKKTLLLLTIIHYHLSLLREILQRPVNCQPSYWAISERAKNNWFFKILSFFQKKNSFFKNSAGNRAPPRQSLVIWFIIFKCITFIQQQHFGNLRAPSVLISHIVHFKVCFFTKSRCFFYQWLTTTPVLQRPVSCQPRYWAPNS